MRCFVLLTDNDGQGISDEVLRQYEKLPQRRGWKHAWERLPNAAVLTAWDDWWGDSLIAQDDEHVAVGMVRLDNRREVEEWTDLDRMDRRGLTDLELVLRVVARSGTSHIPRLLGDFGFIVWHGRTRTAIAAVDAFAVKPMFYTQDHPIIAFGSRAEVLAVNDGYDFEYLVRLLAMNDSQISRTVYAGVRPIPAATFVTLDASRLGFRSYWSPSDFAHAPGTRMSEPEAIDSFHSLFADSVRQRMGAPGATWAQLSGGLDSSSVVSVAQWLGQSGYPMLAGTVSYADRAGTASDERRYSDAVVQRWAVRNEQIIDPPTWHDDGNAPPYTDQPDSDLQHFPRDYRLRDLVRSAGGSVLLTGWGGDEVFAPNMLFFADRIVTGHAPQAIREMMHVAAIGRVSFWQLAYKNVILPLLPGAAQRALSHDGMVAQPWLRRAALRRFGLISRPSIAAEYGGPIGRQYWHARATRARTLTNLATRGVLDDSLDLRHPMLSRPLVEFALSLPPELNARPHTHRWLLREALRGILPEVVRTRIGKQGTGSVSAASFALQQAQLVLLVEDSILAALGIVEPAVLSAAFHRALGQSRSSDDIHPYLESTLVVEAWLQLRAGRWPRGGHNRCTKEYS